MALQEESWIDALSTSAAAVKFPLPQIHLHGSSGISWGWGDSDILLLYAPR